MARACVLQRIAEGIACANALAGHESAQSYERRMEALRKLHAELLRA